MALKIGKGSTMKITKADGSALNKIRLELSWNENGPKKPYDLDATVLAVDLSGGVPGVSVGDQYICYYHQPITPYAKHLKGDNRNGAGSGPDEVIAIDLAYVPANANFIPCILSIDEARKRGQTFADVDSAVAEMFNDETNEHLATIQLGSLEAGSIGALFAGLQRTPAGWEVVNVSQGFPKDLGEFFNLYGVDTE